LITLTLKFRHHFENYYAALQVRLLNIAQLIHYRQTNSWDWRTTSGT